ncbi:hypothetical protein [Georgenia sp. SUBG003]|uniref:hypothetical protein n=1 Tax=Georgenia sp. SUBG003 TaxID=1497974 RepID=UPI003AB610A8
MQEADGQAHAVGGHAAILPGATWCTVPACAVVRSGRVRRCAATAAGAPGDDVVVIADTLRKD